jgi:hypothetical protein
MRHRLAASAGRWRRQQGRAAMDALRAAAIRGETQRLRRFQRQADRIARMIINTNTPLPRVQAEIDGLAEEAQRRFPGQSSLVELIYGSRFRRLWEQFRPGETRLPVLTLPGGPGGRQE